MDSKALKTFRRKMTNPLHWRKANRIFLKYTEADLANIDRAKQLIGDLSSELGISMTPAEQTEAAKWIVKQGINPQSRRDRLGMWKNVK